MKILQLGPIFPLTPLDTGGGSGGTNVTYELSRELAKRGHEVTAFASSYLADQAANYHEPVTVDGVTVRLFPYFFHFSTFFFTPKMLPYLKQAVTECDIVHLHDFRTFQTVAGYYYARKFDIPFVLHGHGTISTGNSHQWQKKAFDVLIGSRIVHEADRLIAVSKEERLHYIQAGADPDKICVVYNGIDVAAFENVLATGAFKRKYGIDGDMILYLGRIADSKGIDVALKAYAALARDVEDVVFVVAGKDVGYETKLRRLVRGLGVEDSVQFCGFLTEHWKKLAYADAALFVHAVLYMGGVGLAPLEAILCGTPAIVTEECGEVIRLADCGYFVNYGDVQGLKEAMQTLLDNPACGQQMVHRGRNYIKDKLTWEIVATKFEEIYESCAR